MDTDEFRVLSAMVQAGLKRRPKLIPVEHARRLAIETELQRRRYCNAFALWRVCRHKACRRLRACGGDAHLCLRRALSSVPQSQQSRARADILKATPHNIGAPERQARQRLPRDCYEERGEKAALTRIP
jgi:hypothetical protein